MSRRFFLAFSAHEEPLDQLVDQFPGGPVTSQSEFCQSFPLRRYGDNGSIQGSNTVTAVKAQ